MRMMVVAVVLAGLAHTVAADPYTIEDLGALARHHEWDELIAHLGDIPSEKRGPAWRDYNERAALGLLARARGGDLGKLEVAEQLRNELTLSDSGEFARQWRALVARLAAPATAWQAGKIAGTYHDAETAVDMFSIAIGRTGGARCAEPVFAEAVVLALGDPAGDRTTVRAHALATTCYRQLAGPLRARLWESGAGFDSDYFANVCGLLAVHDNLSGLQKRECKR